MQESTKIRTGGGVGVGSASMVLLFAVICLATFSLIAYIVASNDKAIVDAEMQLVTGYYEADALAERVLVAMMSSGNLPAAHQGITPARYNDERNNVEITIAYDEQLGAATASFMCPVTEFKALYVRILTGDGSFDILDWRMINTDEWQVDGGMNIWTE